MKNNRYIFWGLTTITSLFLWGCGGNNQNNACTPGELQCAADGASVQECSADGSGFAQLAECSGATTCQDLGNGPTCAEGGTACTPGERRCSSTGIEECDADGSGYASVTECGADQQCKEFTQGTPECGPASCDGNKRFCFEGDVWACAAGSPTMVQQDCDEAASQACVVNAGVAACADVVCTPGEVKCSESGGAVQTCSEDGSGFTDSETCGAGEVCTDDGSGAACGAGSCTPGTQRCSAEGNVEVCGADGTYTIDTPCGENSVCREDGGEFACGPESCERNELFCFGGDIWSCSSGMPGFVFEDCDSSANQECVINSGVGTCAEITCTPDERRCSMDNSAIERCSADGTGYSTTQSCGGDEVCVEDGQGPSCQEMCNPGDRSCSVNGEVQECNSDGITYTTVETCGAGETCGEYVLGAAECGPDTCSGNARFCYDNAVWRCAGSQVTGRAEQCDAATELCAVNSGVAQCITPICAPGELRCDSSGKIIRECNADGTAFMNQTICQGSDVCRSVGNGPECGEAPCTPGETRCSASGDIEQCAPDGLSHVPAQVCDANETCRLQSGSPFCGPASCAGNARFCFEGDVWACNGGTPVVIFDDCDSSANEECLVQSGVAQCLQPACTPGDVRCDPSGQIIQTCNTNGTGYTNNTICQGSDVCRDDLGQGPVCAAPPCTPGELRCSVSGDIEECAQDGNSYTLATNCGAGEACGVYGGTPQCGPDSCAGNARFCFEGDVWSCSGNNPSGLFDTCDPSANEECVVEFGVAQCAQIACAPGDMRCSPGGDIVQTCNANSTGFDNTTICQGSDVCRSVGNGPECGEAPCAPGETRCSASGDIEQCAPDGLSHVPAQVCDANETCRLQSGSPFCGPSSCSGNTRFCFEGDVWACSGGTPTFRFDDCDPTANEECLVEAGFAQCLQPACTPGDVRCDPSGQIIQTCNTNGTGFENSLICSGDDVCRDDLGQSPVCAAPPCTPGELRCSVSGDIEECAQDGNSYTLATNCGAGEACGVYGGTPQCGPDSCAGNARFCFEGDVWSCSGNNPSGLFDTCDFAAGEECVIESGVSQCKLITCTPGEVRCSPGGDVVETCNANGTGFDTTTLCQGSPVCRDIGNGPECGDALCTPGDTRCVAAGDAVEFCDASRQFVAGESCETNELCELVNDTYTCVPQPICQPGEQRCNAGSDGIEECAPDGLAYVTLETCGALEACDIFANGTPECGPATCSGNARFCFEGDVWSCSGSNPTGINDVCEVDEQCLQVQGVFQCATVVCTPGERRCTASDDIEVCDASGTGYQAAESCLNTEICVEGGGDANCVDGSINCQPGYRYDGVSCADIDECAEGTSGCAAICQNTPGSFDCVSSVADMNSPYWSESCPLSQQLSAPTNLIADCRCGTNASLTGGLPLCWRPYEVSQRAPQEDFGAGIRPASHPEVYIYGGFFDNNAREIVAVVDWSGSNDPDAGFVMAFNVDTQARRVISGRYIDANGAAVTKGQGPAFADVKDVRRASNGTMYVLQGTLTRTEILQVNATSGDRTLVWARDGANFGQCANGRGGDSVQVRPEGFELGAAGEFYLGFSNTGLVGEGIGIIEISGDGASCAFVTRSGAGPQNNYSGQDVGAGAAFSSGTLRGFTIRNGELFALNNFDHTMYAIDLNNGDRRRETSANSSGGMGTGPTNSGGLGHRWMQWDSSRNIWWTAGRQGDTQIILVEPGNGNRHDLYCPGGSSTFAGAACVEGSLAAGLSLNYGGFWLDPNDSDIVYFAHDTMGIVKYEVSTGNSIVWSM